jgi:hypothetical protein
MAYDLMPFENMQNKARLLAEAAAGGWTLLLGQDPVNAAWGVSAEERGRYSLRTE